MGIKKGTKLTQNPKDVTLKIRMDAETEEKLVFLSATTGRSKAQVIRDGIEEQYEKQMSETTLQ